MKESLLFQGNLSEALSAENVWSACLKATEGFSAAMGSKYHVCCGASDFSAKVPPDEIGELLSRHDEGSYLITWRDDRLDTMQSYSYFSNEKSLSFRCAQDLVSQPLDAFGSSLANSLPLGNMLIQLQSYLMPMRKLRSPGRNNLYLAPCYNNGRDGYVEGVSAEMWLGDPFWQYARCTKTDLLKQDWLYCEERLSHIYVRAWPEPFSSAESEQGEIQRRLLDFLFGINGKTPSPLPAPAQSTFVQKVLVDGDKVRNLGMEEVQLDGSRDLITPPEPPPLPPAL
jgi:hypothetical protein